MAKSKPKPPQYVADPAHRFLDCKLFHHKKHTNACVNLRGRRICRVNCKPFFDWAKSNPETVVAVVSQMEKQIITFHKEQHSEYTNILENVVPKGDFICEFCAKVFQREKALLRHKLKKHKRESR